MRFYDAFFSFCGEEGSFVPLVDDEMFFFKAAEEGGGGNTEYVSNVFDGGTAVLFADCGDCVKTGDFTGEGC